MQVPDLLLYLLLVVELDQGWRPQPRVPHILEPGPYREEDSNLGGKQKVSAEACKDGMAPAGALG
jgi:hypothetical protein